MDSSGARAPRGFIKFIPELKKGRNLKGSVKANALATNSEIKQETIQIITRSLLKVILLLSWNQKNHNNETMITPFTKLLSTINIIRLSNDLDVWESPLRHLIIDASKKFISIIFNLQIAFGSIRISILKI